MRGKRHKDIKFCQLILGKFPPPLQVILLKLILSNSLLSRFSLRALSSDVTARFAYYEAPVLIFLL